MISDEELIDEIIRLASHGTPPTTEEFREDGRFAVNTVKHHFGSYNDGMREAGFEPNSIQPGEDEYDKKQLLQAIREHRTGARAPTRAEFQESETTLISSATVWRYLGKWWQAVVQAGLIPQTEYPLTADQFRQFHQEATARRDPEESLVGLILLFTGLPAELVPEVERSWFDYLSDDRYDTILTVPDAHLHSDAPDEWVVKLPTNYTVAGVTENTQLPKLAEWFFLQSDRSLPSRQTVLTLSHRIARDAEISRHSTNIERIGKCPNVMPSDLRASAGVQMARAGAPRRRIRRHLGIEHTGWQADVDDFFLWLYVHEDYTHPDYEPPDVVLDPVDPNSPAE